MSKMCTVKLIRGESVKVIADYMLNHIDNHYDGCGELNLTALAEDAANSFDLYEDDGNTTSEEVFELAYDVAQKLNSLH